MLSPIDRGWERPCVECARSAARHAGAADPQNPGRRRSPARLRDCPAPQIRIRRSAPGRRKLALSRAATPAAQRLGERRLGRIREKPPRPVLYAHASWQETAGGGTPGIRPADRRDSQSPEPCLEVRMRDLLRRVWYVIRQRQFERDLAEEIEFHRAMAQRDLERRGIGLEAAGSAARRLLGNTTLAREDSRGVWIWPWLESIWQDVAYAVRNLRRQPGFTAVVVTVLATVIGLHTTLVTVIAGVVLRPWPGVRDAGRVVAIYLVGQFAEAGRFASFPVDAYRGVAAGAATLTGVVASLPDDVRVGSGAGARMVGSLLVSGNFFDVLGVAVAPGRGFAADEDRAGRPAAVVVLSYDFWQSRFGGDPS